MNGTATMSKQEGIVRRVAKLSPIILAQLASESHAGTVHELPNPIPAVSHEHTPEESLIDNLAGLDSIAARPDARDRFRLDVRTGLPPASITAPDSGTLLSTVEIDSTGRGSAEIVNLGTAGHFRIRNSVGIIVSQGKVTAPGEDGEMVTDNNVCVAGGLFVIGG